MKLKISENKYGNPTIKYKSKENYFSYRDTIEKEYLEKIPYDIYINLEYAFQDVKYEERNGFYDIYNKRVIMPEATKLYYNKLTYSINELVNDISNIIDDYVNYNIGFVSFDGIKIDEKDGCLNHVGIADSIYEPDDPKYYNSLQEVLNDLKEVSNIWNDTKISRLYIELN